MATTTTASIIRDRDQQEIGTAILTDAGVSRYLGESKHTAISLSIVTDYIGADVTLDPEHQDTPPDEPVLLGWID